MPTATTKLQKLREESGDKEIPYISKSRLKTFVSCPRKFYYNYVLGIRPAESYHMVKGSRIHLIFEKYYENLIDYHTNRFTDELPQTVDDLTRHLPDDGHLWVDWVKPYVANFIAWELERAKNVSSVVYWLPVGIEAEAWYDGADGPPWMGFADVIIPAQSVSEVEEDEGVVIVDFKTGKTPKEKYRDEGIYLEGEYYGMLFEDEFDVVGVAGYFPKNHDFVVSPLSGERRKFIRDTIEKINEIGADKEKFETDTSPLCRYGPGDDEKCSYYSVCSAGRGWGAPAERWDEFVADVENGMSKPRLSDKYWTNEQDTESIHYWYWKAETIKQ